MRNRDYTLIAVLGKYLLKARSSAEADALDLPRDYGVVMRNLLEHKLVDARRIDSLLEEMKWAVDDEYLVYIVNAEAVAREQADAYLQLSLNLAQLQPHMKFTLFGDRSIFICNLSKTGKTRADTISLLTPTLRDMLVKASFSTTFRDFKNLYYYYRQAMFTEEAGIATNPSFWVFRYEDYAIETILAQCLRKTIPATLFPPGLISLIEYDRTQGTSFVKLLSLYLDNDRNIAKTSRAAFIHRNTFLYQIGRIKEVLHMDLDNADNRVTLQVALRAYERETNRDQE